MERNGASAVSEIAITDFSIVGIELIKYQESDNLTPLKRKIGRNSFQCRLTVLN